MSSYPDDNPKTIYGVAKPGIMAVPAVALYHLGQAMADGMRKYGLYNWREKTVSSSVYFEAGNRHRWQWWDGEEEDPISKVHHLAHSMACDAIILDALASGKLNDDRGFSGKLSEFIRERTKETSAPQPEPPRVPR